MKEGIPVIPVATGKKGIHTYFLLRPMSYEDPKGMLMSASEGIIQKVFGNEKNTIDQHGVGDIRRIARIPNTLRPPENKSWCTFIDPDDLLAMKDESDVVVHTKSIHHLKLYFESNKTLMDLPSVDLDLPNNNGHDDTFTNLAPKSFVNNFWKGKDSVKLLSRILRPCVYRRLIEKHPIHVVRMAAAIDLLIDFSPEEIAEAFRPLGWSDWDYGMTLYQLESCKGLKPYSCKTLMRYGIPTICCEEFDKNGE
jgi:hypothetical protein